MNTFKENIPKMLSSCFQGSGKLSKLLKLTMVFVFFFMTFQINTFGQNCNPVQIAYWNLDNCFADVNVPGSNTDYSEFPPQVTTPFSCGGNVVVSTLDRPSSNAAHSCSFGLNNTLAMCVPADQNSCSFYNNDPEAIIFTVQLTPSNGGQASLTKLQFFEQAPVQGQWWTGQIFNNNYPTRYGIRVTVNGQQVFKQTNINTTTNWTLENFDFTSDPDFTVTSTTTFKFELRAYCPSGSQGIHSAWDLENIKVFGCCGPIDPCANAGGDSDGDGVCNNQDCQPFNPALPTAPGTPCNDGNASTVNDVIQSDGCSCTGTFDPCANAGGDSDGDGVCNNQDCQPFNPSLPTTTGTPCNDGNASTVNDVIQSDGCSCAGTFDPCANAGGDSDGDGVCNNQDCQPFNPSLPTTPGMPCNDGNTSTVNDVIQSDGCSCAGTFNPCTNVGGDSDGDGVCNNEDCQPYNPALPTVAGTACNDGNVNTSNDVIQSDGCTCLGTPTGGNPDCDTDITITVGTGKITISGLDAAPISTVQVFNSAWGTEYSCTANCSATEMINLSSGTYYVYVKYYSAGWQLICQKNIEVTINGNNPCANAGGDSDGDGICNNQDCQPFNPSFPTTPGTPCNDGNPNTTNDVITANGCDCQGTVSGPCANAGGDSDGDGVCNDQDCQPFNAAFPATPGASCNDGDPNTLNDVISVDGCSCSGTPAGGGDPDCEQNISISAGNGTIIVSGLNGAPISSLQVFTASWQTAYSCFANCGDAQTIPVSAGTYLVYAKYYTSSYSLICEKQTTITVGGGGGGSCLNVANGGIIGIGSNCSNFFDYCPNQSAVPTLGNCIAPIGGSGTLETIWLKSTSSCTFPTTTIEQIQQGLDPHWSIVTGATGLSYTPANINQATCFLRCSRRAGCTTYIESNIVSVSISSNCGGGSGNPDCGNIGISTGAGQITVTGLDGAPVTSVQVFSSVWQPEYQCFGNCSPTSSFPVAAGDHYVYVKFYDSSYNLICEVNETIYVSQNLSAVPTLEFEAVKHEEHSELYWVHNGGADVSDYVIERSDNGIDFEEIDVLASKGGTANELYLSYDLSPNNGDNYYRVRLNFIDGSIEFTTVQILHFPDLPHIVLFPNPANGFVKANLEDWIEKEDVIITIHNNLGITLKQFEIDKVTNKYFQMDLRELKEGHYVLWFEVEGRRPLAKKLIIVKL